MKLLKKKSKKNVEDPITENVEQASPPTEKKLKKRKRPTQEVEIEPKGLETEVSPSPLKKKKSKKADEAKESAAVTTPKNELATRLSSFATAPPDPKRLLLTNCPEGMSDQDIFQHYQPLGKLTTANLTISWVQTPSESESGAVVVSFPNESFATAGKKLVPFLVNGTIIRVAFAPTGLYDSIKRTEPAKEEKTTTAAASSSSAQTIDDSSRPSVTNADPSNTPKPAAAASSSTTPSAGEKDLSWRAPTENELYVSRCPETITEEHIFNHFASLGPEAVVSLRWAFDPEKKFRGFGFVTMSSPEMVKRALAMDPPVVDGKTLLVQPAGRRLTPATEQLFLGNCPKEMTEAHVREHYRSLGPTAVLQIRWVKRPTEEGQVGAAFVTFADAAAATAAKQMVPFKVNGRIIRVEQPLGKDRFEKRNEQTGAAAESSGSRKRGGDRKDEPSIFIGRCPMTTSDEDIYSHYEILGGRDAITEIRWIHDKVSHAFRGCGFVVFASQKLAEKAAAMKPPTIDGRTLTVRLSNAPPADAE